MKQSKQQEKQEKQGKKWKVLLVVFPAGLYFILTTPSRIGFIDRTEVGAWMGYYAAILGGSLTLLGVYATIKNQEKSKMEEKAVQFKPILDIATNSEIPTPIGYREVGLNVMGYSTKSKGESEYIFKNQTQKETFFFVLKNKGRGETSKAILKGLEITDGDLDWTGKNELYPSYGSSYIGEILSDGYIKIFIYLPRYLLIKKGIDLKKPLRLNTIMEIQYNDMFDENSYMYAVHIRFLINLDENDHEDVNLEYLAVKASYSLDQVMPDRKKLQ